MTRLISEYLQEQFYFIGLNNKAVSMLENYHMTDYHCTRHVW